MLFPMNIHQTLHNGPPMSLSLELQVLSTDVHNAHQF